MKEKLFKKNNIMKVKFPLPSNVKMQGDFCEVNACSCLECILIYTSVLICILLNADLCEEL